MVSYIYCNKFYCFSQRIQYSFSMTQKPKIAILHDAFLYRGGGERLVTLMAKALDADIISGFFSEGSFDPRELGFTGKIISLGTPVFAKGIRHLVLKWRFFWRARILRDYDIVIFSGDCLGALRHIQKSESKNPESKIQNLKSHKRQKVFYYCHTPPRYLYDFRAKYIASLPFFVRPIFALAFTFFSYRYEKNLAKFDQIFTNSKTVQKRLRDYTLMDSVIIYPPTDTSFFSPAPISEIAGIPFLPKTYFYSWARLSPPKRVDLIVDAFLDMPDQNLVFSYGKNDPMKESIFGKIKDAKNIIALEAPSDELLLSLIRWATATIYIPVDEDFGMTPIESMACGIPVIWANEWWLRETIIDGETGFLIDVNSENLKKAVEKMTPEYTLSLEENCVRRADEFSLEKFESRISEKII